MQLCKKIFRVNCTDVKRTLSQAEETGGEDSWTEKAEEDGGTYEVITDIFLLPLLTPLAEGAKHILQFTENITPP